MGIFKLFYVFLIKFYFENLNNQLIAYDWQNYASYNKLLNGTNKFRVANHFHCTNINSFNTIHSIVSKFDSVYSNNFKIDA